MRRLGAMVARALAGELQSIQTDVRAQVEESLLSWAIENEKESWGLDPETNEIEFLGLTLLIGVFSVSVYDVGLGWWYAVGCQCDYLMETTHDEIKAVGFAGSAGSGAAAF